MALIACFGSLNLDLTLPVASPAADDPRRPGPAAVPGGKGYNQATAAAWLAGPATSVAMVGAVGDDAAGGSLVAGPGRRDRRPVRVALRPACRPGPRCAWSATTAPAPSWWWPGQRQGEGVGGAEAAAAVLGADVLLLQGEVPVDASVRPPS